MKGNGGILGFLFLIGGMMIPLTTSANQDGKTLYSIKGCISCHGEEGREPIAVMYPKLNGQNQAYLVTQIQDIQSGKRKNSYSIMMKPLVARLSKKEIEAISAYLSELSEP